MYLKKSCALFALLLSSVVGVTAQEAPSTALPDLTVKAGPWNEGPNLSSSLGIEIDPGSTPIVGSSFDEAFLRRRGALDIRQALINSPGVTDGSSSGVHDLFVVRGFDSLNGGAILMDGILEPEATIYPLYNIEQVDLLKGPGSFLYGPNALTGTANLIRKKPLFDQEISTLRLGIGSHNDYRVELDQNLASENTFASRVNLFYRQGDSHRDDIEFEQNGINPSIIWQLNEQTQLTAFFDYLKSDITPDAGLPTLGSRLASEDEERNFGLSDDESEQEVYRIGAGFNHVVNDGLTVRNKTYYNQLDWESRGTILAGFVAFGLGAEPAPRTLSRLQADLDDKQKVYGTEFEAVRTFDLSDMDHTLVLGTEFTRHEDTFSLAINPATNIDLPTGAESPGFLPAFPTNVGDTTADFIGVYAYDQVAVTESTTLLAGARVDFYDFEDDAKGIETDDTLFSPFGGAVVGVTESVSLFGNAGIGFAPPSTQSLDPSGDPEESLQYETGIRLQPAACSWRAQASVFYIERSNIGIPNATGAFTEEGEQESEGAEIEIAGNVTDAMRLRASYTWLDSELSDFSESFGRVIVDRSGATAPFAPENVAQLWSEYQLTASLGLGLGVRYVDEQFISADNSFVIDDYVTVDASLFFEQENWGVYLAIHNITDETIYTRGLGNTSVIPEDGINATATLEIKL